MEVTEEEHKFISVEKFLDWKQNVEIATNSCFVKGRGNHTSVEKNVQTYYYYCNQSGMHV